jgi:hypothetical protein
MENKKNDFGKKALHYLGYATLAGALTFGVNLNKTYANLTEILDSKFNFGKTLDPKDFKEAEWIITLNPTGTIWNPYMAEDIAHNQVNWFAYITEVKKKNNGELEGIILLPDLDKNNSVGKR